MDYMLKNGLTLTVREVKVSDVKDVLEYMTKVNTESKNLSREPEEWTMTEEDEESFLKRVESSSSEYMLTAWDKDVLVSVCGFHGSSLKRLNHRVNLGMSVLKKYYGMGIGSLLMELLVDGARDYGKKKVELEVRIDNLAAIHIYEKVGFIKEGIKRDAFYVDGKYVDLLLMAVHL